MTFWLVVGALLGAMCSEGARWWWRRGKVPARPLSEFTTTDFQQLRLELHAVEALTRSIDVITSRLSGTLKRVDRLRAPTVAQPAIPAEKERRRAT